ncbi:ABC transporter ATP-binding protein/permease [Bariatricus massiliensis]|nr:ABC transporter ATP-binding protein/permease [Bariatricus massiliensis]MDY2663750.1 ABC transporter ATP-binding protein [Bariatricus massiliensis]
MLTVATVLFLTEITKNGGTGGKFPCAGRLGRDTEMRYMKEILQTNKAMIIVYIASGIACSFLANYKADYFQRIIDGLAGDTLALSGIVIYGAVIAADYCLSYLDEYPAKKLENGIYLDFKLLALKKISKIDYLEYQKLGTGKLANRIENGAEAGKGVLFDFYFCLVRQLIPTVCFSVYFIWRISARITCLIIGGYLLVFMITAMLLKVLYRIKEKILTGEEQMNHYLVRGFMEMVLFRFERQFPMEIEKASEAREQIVGAKVKMNLVHEAFFTMFALMEAALEIGVLLYTWKTGGLSAGAAVALIGLIHNAYTPIAVFNVLFVQYKLDKTAFKRFEAFLKAKEDEGLYQGVTAKRVSGCIQIRNLRFSYGERLLFDGLNLSLRPGEKVAFVGESGSGKSTLVKIIGGLLKYEEGSICIDGTEVKELCLDSLYAHMNYISQEAPVFDGTLRTNLVFYKNVEENRLCEALEKMGLDFLLRQAEQGLDTDVGERGMMLSGGEKQRLALARLWLFPKQIVILDEATSAIDNLTEEKAMEELLRVLEGRTVIAVAHRLSSVRKFNRIVVFNRGKIVGEGSYEELLETNSYFRQLYESGIKVI